MVYILNRILTYLPRYLKRLSNNRFFGLRGVESSKRGERLALWIVNRTLYRPRHLEASVSCNRLQLRNTIKKGDTY